MPENLINYLESSIQSSPILAVFISLLAGILTSFTPCIYPLIPVTLGFIGAKGSETRLRGLYLSLMYVLGLAIVYSFLGAFAALTGKFFGQIQTNPWAYFIVANIYILFGLAMLGVININFSWLSKIRVSGKKNKGGLSAVLFGGSSALIAAPCSAPVLGVLLTYVGTKQNIFFGLLMLFFFAFGLGFILILIGTFTGLMVSFPKSGPWMVGIKKGMGILMILMGEYLLFKMGQLMI